MLKYCLKKWDKNKDKLFDAVVPLCGGEYSYKISSYEELMRLILEHIFNDEEAEMDCRTINTKEITEIDNGDYQGTLLYLFHFDTYQPCEYEYFVTFVGYGSCSGCDILQGIESLASKKRQIDETMQLCLDIVQNITKPYDYGWRKDEEFETVEFKEERETK